MNQEIEQEKTFLSWQGQVTGPHTIREIQTLLKLGRIHSLYKIKVEGEWIMLRHRLAELEQNSREASKRPGSNQIHDTGSGGLRAVPVTKTVPDEDGIDSASGATSWKQRTEDGDDGDGKSKGIAITSFVLSLLFFVPFLNGITWLLSLIFGHLAFSRTDNGKPSKSSTLAWVGLWISYVEISFFLLGFGWFAITRFSRVPMMLAYLFLHAQMLYTVVAALIGGGVLMLVVKFSSGSLIGYTRCFVGALAPAAFGALGTLLIQSLVASFDLEGTAVILLVFAQYILLFVAQMFFWARFIRLPDDSELGLGRAALCSLFYTIIFFVIGIGYFMLFTALSPNIFRF